MLFKKFLFLVLIISCSCNEQKHDYTITKKMLLNFIKEDSMIFKKREYNELLKSISDDSYQKTKITKVTDEFIITNFAVETEFILYSTIRIGQNCYYISNSDDIKWFRYNFKKIEKGLYGKRICLDISDSSIEVATLHKILNENEIFNVKNQIKDTCDEFCKARIFTGLVSEISLILVNSFDDKFVRVYSSVEDDMLSKDSIWHAYYDQIMENQDIYKNTEVVAFYNNYSKSLCFFKFTYDSKWRVQKMILINRFSPLVYAL